MNKISMLAMMACAVAFAMPGLNASTAPPPFVSVDWGPSEAAIYQPVLPAMFIRAEDPLEITAKAIGALGVGLKIYVKTAPVEMPAEMPHYARAIEVTYAAKPPGNPVLRPGWRGAWDFAAFHSPVPGHGREDPRAA